MIAQSEKTIKRNSIKVTVSEIDEYLITFVDLILVEINICIKEGWVIS